jgi:hypothetical protein
MSIGRRAEWFAAVVAALLLGGGVALAQNADSLRSVSGTVTDDGHEPLKGAVVELENPVTHQVVSYLTAADGTYAFKRLDSHTDFQVWATFRGHKSAVHNVSMFDSHMAKVVDIVCKTY